MSMDPDQLLLKKKKSIIMLVYRCIQNISDKIEKKKRKVIIFGDN